MSETINKQKNKKTSKKAEILFEQTVHPVLIFYGISFALLIIYYSIFLNKFPLSLTLCFLAIDAFFVYYNFFKRKIVITKNKFYVYRLGKKVVSLSYAKDFLHIKYEQTKLGKVFNYGSILLVTQQNMYYKVHFIKEPNQVFLAAINEYENLMVLLDPTYERQFKNVSSNGKKQYSNSEEEFEKIDD